MKVVVRQVSIWDIVQDEFSGGGKIGGLNGHPILQVNAVADINGSPAELWSSIRNPQFQVYPSAQKKFSKH